MQNLVSFNGLPLLSVLQRGIRSTLLVVSTVALSSVILSGSVSAQDKPVTSASPFMSEQSEANQRAMITYALHEAGVYDLLEQVPELISQEIGNLKASMPLSRQELKSLKKNLASRLESAEINASILRYVQSRLSEEQLLAIKDILQSSHVLSFKQMQQDADNELTYGRMRSYKVKLKERAPNKNRLVLVETLDASIGQTRLETEIKVELRKNLLANVSLLKTEQVLSEALLEKQMADYRQRVGDHINENARVFYLYLFKRTPSANIRQLIGRYSNPEFEKFMAVCESAIVSVFRKARRDAYDDMKLAGN